LEEQGVKLTGARPFLNGYKPSTFTYGEHWCQPVVAMHHMTSHEISSMWRFERRREVIGAENVSLTACGVGRRVNADEAIRSRRFQNYMNNLWRHS
jgi:hypothetical protein